MHHIIIMRNGGRRFYWQMQVLCYDEENFPDVIEAELVEDKNNTSSTIVILATLFEVVRLKSNSFS